MGNFHGVQISFFLFFMMGIFSCVKWTVLHRKITHTNQLEIAQKKFGHHENFSQHGTSTANNLVDVVWCTSFN